MSFQRFLIAPFEVGLERDMEAWLLPQDALVSLTNAFIFRGRIKKRFGYRLLGDPTDDNPQLNSRLRANVGTTNGAGNFAGAMPGTVFKVGQLFSVGNNMFTVNATGNPAALLVNGTGTGTFDTTTGALTLTGTAATTDVYFYPSEPVMGLRTREDSTINEEEIIAFDTQFAYDRSGGAWERIGTGAVNTWTGDNSQFFWSSNYRGVAENNTNFYVTNFNFVLGGAGSADNIRYIASGASTFTSLQPQLDTGGTMFLETCRCILPFKNRLVTFNTIESNGPTFSQYSNRCRFSQNGDPTDTTNGWLDDTPGRGGYIDAPTKQAIISSEFIKDKLIVYFESSTWELVYTANEILPFRWQKINTELGAESTFSVVPFDKTVLSVGNRGITACTGVDIQRIDAKIPDEVFSIHNGNDGPERVYGVRDYYTETVYWTFPDEVGNPTYPNRVLVYNYLNNTWAFYEDTFTCFGYFQPSDDTRWNTLSYDSWEVWNDPWNTSYLQSGFQTIIAGNQEGFTVLIDRDKGDNDAFYQITDISSSTLTVVDHNFKVGEYFLIENAGGVTGVNDTIALVIGVTDANTITIDLTATGTYTGGGTLRRISNFNVVTKRFNPFINLGVGLVCPYMDFFVDKTSSGEFTVDFFLNESDYSIRNNANALPGTAVMSTAPYPLVNSEEYQDRLWHRMYFYSTGFNIQFRFYLSPDQMKDYEIARSDFVINGLILYASKAEKVVG